MSDDNELGLISEEESERIKQALGTIIDMQNKIENLEEKIENLEEENDTIRKGAFLVRAQAFQDASKEASDAASVETNRDVSRALYLLAQRLTRLGQAALDGGQ